MVHETSFVVVEDELSVHCQENGRSEGRILVSRSNFESTNYVSYTCYFFHQWWMRVQQQGKQFVTW